MAWVGIAGRFCNFGVSNLYVGIRETLLVRANHGSWCTLTLSTLSLPLPPKTRLGRVGKPSGLGPPEMGVGMGDGECAGEATRGFWA